jgi:hypothetical protein
MKTINWMNLLKQCFVAISIFSIAACSAQQQTDEDLEVSEYDDQGDNSDLGNDDAAEGNAQENFVDESDNQENYGNGDNNYNEATNSDTEEENLDEAAEDDEFNATLNNTGNNELVSDDDLAGSNQYENQAQPVPVSTDDMTPAPTASVPSNSAPIPGGRVRYVVEGGAQVTNGPGGSIVLTLAQGEHPVTWEENGFFKMAEGYYIAQESLSESGVGRPVNSARWNGGAAGGAPAKSGGDYGGYNY